MDNRQGRVRAIVLACVLVSAFVLVALLVIAVRGRQGSSNVQAAPSIAISGEVSRDARLIVKHINRTKMGSNFASVAQGDSEDELKITVTDDCSRDWNTPAIRELAEALCGLWAGVRFRSRGRSAEVAITFTAPSGEKLGTCRIRDFMSFGDGEPAIWE